MAQFGGYSQFGGGSHFGGAESLGAVYHRLLRDLEPPGVFSESVGTVRDDRLAAHAKGLGVHGEDMIQRIMKEVFPRLAEESLDEWSEIFQEGFAAGATLAQKQAAMFARWVTANLSDLPTLRSIFSPFIGASIGFWDRCDDSDVSFRLTQRAGGGAIAESTLLTLSVSSGVPGDWSEDEDVCARVSTKIVDPTDDLTVWCKIDAIGATNGHGGGPCLYTDGGQAIAVEAYRDAGADKARVWLIEGFVDSHGVGQSITLPAWVGLKLVGGSVTAVTGSDPDDDSTHSTIGAVTEISWKPRLAGWFCRNFSGSGYPVGNVDFDDLRIDYATPENNVEIIETPASTTPADAPENVFSLFVHIDEDDPTASPDLTTLQRLADRLTQAHTVMMVGRSDFFRCDDSDSLLDRDVLGR